MRGKVNGIFITGIISLGCWTVFQLTFHRDRSKYRNCYLLFLSLASLFPFFFNLLGPYGGIAAVVTGNVILLSVLIVPFFLIYNGIVMIRKEGGQLPHLLSLAFGILLFVGEVVTGSLLLAYSLAYGPEALEKLFRSPLFLVGAAVSTTVIYCSMAFGIFMIYVLFLHIIPKKRDFDYVIIHGAGLLEGDRISRLLRERLDKAIAVYFKDPTPPKLIPSGGRGADEKISEAEAMAGYLAEHGIPEGDIIPEDRSTTTYENLLYSKQILDGLEGPKYIALVTSNYHVYRALRYCRKVGISCTGIGSRVAFYYWPSAMIREFIAIHAEKKHAVVFIAGWILSVAGVIRLLLR